MDDYDWLSHSTMSICERATFMIESLALERAKLARWREERREQERQLAACEGTDQSSDKEHEHEVQQENKTEKDDKELQKLSQTEVIIREERRKRVAPEPKEGIVIALRFGEIKARRKFKETALFQVYTILYIKIMCNQRKPLVVCKTCD
ncbi:uncharacterized protein LOC110051676 [Orbicella faveolata]|uniref:uncharacterized protein LOC110051676 n=1 Tax=Orbicella faveolata TaxID=48498 RepID=UPI0009E295D5|nr:uncharacterized protein LOC110051676 [Orbicella faveolata]